MLLLSLLCLRFASAGGTAENILLIINPTDPDSLYVGNYYKNARGIPDENVLYLSSDSPNYGTFVNDQVAALLGTIDNRDLMDHIDYVVLAPGVPYRISASNLISDGCAAVHNFAVDSSYGMAFLTDQILGGWVSTARNGYADTSGSAGIAFDSEIGWMNGQPSEDPSAQHMFIAGLLGYTGDLGNTVPEIIAMIDRSVAVEGTFPGGTFYFMETNDPARSGPREQFFDRAVSMIISDGGMAEHLCCNPLPVGRHDALGIMTGIATLDFANADMTILPGAFCDHLTSFAGNFGTTSQTKMSRWIANGASGTWGTVEEPCNYAGKFPHAFTHVQYFRGMSLGESVMRDIGFVPFQGLFLGDPMTRPYTHIPSVDLAGVPGNGASGIVVLTPSATTTHPTAQIASHDLLVDGRLYGSVVDGEAFGFDTTRFDDGWHELRVISYDDDSIKDAGRWIGSIDINNHGESAVISQIDPVVGDLATAFTVNASVNANGHAITEIDLVHNGRVVASSADVNLPMVVHGRMLGAGVSTLRVVARLSDGSVISSAPAMIDISTNAGAPIGDIPVAFDYTKRVIRGDTVVVELPATADDSGKVLSYNLLSSPAQGSVHTPGDSAQSYRIVTINPDASGSDQMTFEVSDGVNTSNVATVTLQYQACIFGDLTLDVGPLFVGQTGVFTVTCGYPNDLTYLVYSLKGTGSTPVPALNVTLDLRQPKLADQPMMTDSDGSVVWNLTIPNVQTPKRVFFQAMQRSVTSNWLYRDITN